MAKKLCCKSSTAGSPFCCSNVNSKLQTRPEDRGHTTNICCYPCSEVCAILTCTFPTPSIHSFPFFQSFDSNSRKLEHFLNFPRRFELSGGSTVTSNGAGGPCVYLNLHFVFFLACVNFKKGFCDSLFATTMFPAPIH